MPGKTAWASALGRIASGLYILTARQESAETGMLASWVQQCSFDPPLITLALKRGRGLASWLQSGATFVVNILDDSQTDLISHFGRGFAPGENAFDGLAVNRTLASAPVLPECLAFLECRIEQSFPAGDHDLFLARIVAGQVLAEGHPMVHVRKNGLHY